VKSTIVVFLFLVTTSTRLLGQKSTINQNLYWLRYYNQFTLNKKFVWHNELEERRFFDKNRLNNLIIHSRLHYNLKPNTEIAIGLTYSLQNPQNPNSTSNLIIPEIRPVQEFNYTMRINNKLSLQQRLRIDERFIRKNDGEKLLDGYNFNFRFRLRFQLIYKLKEEKNKNQTTLKIADELMINAGKDIVYNQFDQNRIYIGIQQKLNKNVALELGYLKLHQQKASGNQFLNRDIVRLSLYHRLTR
jgi:hypothetical protein